MTVATNYGKLGHMLLAVGGEIGKSTLTGGEFPPNAMGFLADQMGPKYFRYVQNRNGSDNVQGALMARVGDKNGNTAVNNITSGTTYSCVTSGLTADAHNGGILWVLDNADSAGAAPEAEMLFITRNTATVILCDRNYPLTTALAVNDDLQLIATQGVEAAASGDTNSGVAGVVVAADGLPNGYWGWIQTMGMCRCLMKASTALTINGMVVADTARITANTSTSKPQEMIGVAQASISSDVVSDFALIRLSCGEHAMGGYSDIDGVA